jgi:prevent-host-death family protein
MDSVTVAHAKAHLSEVLGRVQAGGTVTITRRGKAIATLQPVTRPKRALDLSNVDAVRRKLPSAKTTALELIRVVRSERG